MLEFKINKSELTFCGDQLDRPECVVTTAAGRLFASDRVCGIRQIYSDKPSSAVGSATPENFLCNGFSLQADGTFLAANLGDDGGVWQIAKDESPIPVLLEVDGVRLPPTNFVNVVGKGADQVAWISISTRHVPRDDAFRSEIADGFIVCMDRRGARIVADNIGFTNENKLHPDGQWLYISETIARRLSRYRVQANGDLGDRETVFEFADGIWPDGIEFDQQGGIWIASVVSNRLVRLAPDGRLHTILDDSDPDVVAAAEARFAAGEFSRSNIDAGKDGVLGNLASVSFGGSDLKTVYLGSLFSQQLAVFRSPVAGAVPHHWNY